MPGTIIRKQRDQAPTPLDKIIEQLRETYDDAKANSITGDINLDIQVSKGGIHRSKISVSRII